MPLGDSITAGTGSETGAGYRLPLWNMSATQSRYTVDFVGSAGSAGVPDPDNEGHSGARIGDIRASVDTWLTAAAPDVVLLHIGINDLDKDPDPDKQRAVTRAANAFSDLVTRIVQDKPNVTVLAQGLIPTTGGLQEQAASFNTKIKALQYTTFAGKKYRYLEPPALSGNEMFDRLHPSDFGYARMAGIFHDGLENAVTAGLAERPTAPRAGSEAGWGRVKWADFDGDGRSDYITVNTLGAVSVWLNRGGDGHGGWEEYGQVATGVTGDSTRVRFADFDGDGRADYILIGDTGSVTVHLNKGGDGHGGWKKIGQVATGTTSDADHVRFADIDGDGKTDYTTFSPRGALSVYLNRGGDTSGSWTPYGQIATGVTGDLSRVRIADFDGDGRADYNVINTSGSLTTYLNRGGDGHGGWDEYGQVATGVTNDQNSVVLADITGEGRADYLHTNPDGSIEAYLDDGGDGHGGWIPYGQIATGA
ncbi:FG-GAP-like repeat-containing protein [Streptomyces sp. R44]|uniref:FG-GAP-like repeat-containing protein n=1 Tax=Streptomyces sp. R44 TaxID=3238633 RepID=A0AB39TFQ9_9ACTN